MGFQEMWNSAVLGGNQLPPTTSAAQTVNAALGAAVPDDPAPRFRERVCVAAVAAAIAIANEGAAVPNHAARAAFAKAVVTDPFSLMGPLSLALASQGLDNTSDDASISSALAAVWNTFSGSA